MEMLLDRQVYLLGFSPTSYLFSLAGFSPTPSPSTSYLFSLASPPVRHNHGAAPPRRGPPGTLARPLPSLRFARREACDGGGTTPLNPAAAQRQVWYPGCDSGGGAVRGGARQQQR
uniref:Uncharacterized protein n=1 Tax=Oryza barthii TaxID=65489 RepID=A0A0D3HDJ9_9ORYZ